MEDEGKNPIQVAEKLFQVIELLAENGPMGIMDLSNRLGFHKSTVHRLVASLQHMGYIRQEEGSLKYFLSLKFLQIGSRILEQNDMAEMIHPALKKLSEQVGETVHLVRREGTEAVYIDKVEFNVGSIRMVSRVGSRIPLYCSGVGKALLAELPDEKIREIWEESEIVRLTPRTITSFEELMEHLRKVRQDGYAIDDEENEEGVRCIAVSLCDYHKEPVYAISISAPLSRMTTERIMELKTAVLDFKKEIAGSLGLGRMGRWYHTAFQMAWPAVMESFFIALASLVDSLMVSSMGAYAVAAVGLTTQPKFIGLCIFIAANVSVSALVARRRGEKDRYGANQVLLMILVFVLASDSAEQTGIP